MQRYLLKRLIDAVPTVLLVLTLVFAALRILPGDPALAILGDRAPIEQVEAFRHKLGLDRPLLTQYVTFVSDALTGTFGRSLANDTPVAKLIGANLPYTLELTLAATLISIVVGIPIGIISATHHRKTSDYVARVFGLAGYCIPDFFLGALLMLYFGLHLDLLPVMGGGEGFPFLSRLTRASMLEVLRMDYVRTARAKGLKPILVVYKHALRNALIPIVTGIGIYILSALSGSIAIELVFSRPGLGQMMIGAVESRDYPVVQAAITVFALFVVGVNLAVDMAYAVINPRVRVEAA
jgi:peptide/nickel transport system permease protein